MKAEQIQQFSEAVLIAAGSEAAEARVVSEALLWCDKVGRPNQGVWRLPILCERLSRALFESPCNFQVQMQSATLGCADGGAGQGHYVATQAMQHCIETARREGLCALTVRNSNYYGAGGYYAWLAAQAGMVGIALSNSFPKVRAHNGTQAVLGTNPLAFACPALDGEPLILDMATSELAGSTVRKQREQAGGNANVSAGVLDPFGGAKGYGLGLMVDVFAGVLSGGGFSHDVKSMYNDFQHSGNSGHFFLTLDIERLMPLAEFQERMHTLIEWLRASGDAVRYPGENRWKEAERNEREGIVLDEATMAALQELGSKYGVPGP